MGKLVKSRKLVGDAPTKKRDFSGAQPRDKKAWAEFEKRHPIRLPDETMNVSTGTLPFDKYPKFSPHESEKTQIVEYHYKGKKVKIRIRPIGGGFRIEARVGRIKTARRFAHIKQQAFEKYYVVIDQSNQWIDNEWV